MFQNSKPATPLTTRDPDDFVSTGVSGQKTISDLVYEARELSQELPDGQYAINLNTNRYAYLRAFCASLFRGHITLMPPNRQPETLGQLEDRYPGSYRIGEKETRQAPSNRSAKIHSDQIPWIKEDRIVAIAFTSGSTGNPTPIQKHWHTLRVGAETNHAAVLGDFKENKYLVSTVPSQHMWGFETSVLLPLKARVTVSDSNPLYPQDIADALARRAEPRLLVSSPLHLRALMSSGVEVPGITRILTATAPLSREDARKLEDHFQTEVLDAFGCSESGVIATRRTSREREWKLSPPFSLEATEQGTLITASHLAEKVMLPDRVELVDDRTFHWIGRNHDMVNIAGKRGSLADLNHRLVNIEGVEDGVIFQPEDSRRLAAMVVAPTLTSADILTALRSQIDPAFVPRPVYQVSHLPRQETGKLSQRAIMELYHSVRIEISERSGKNPKSEEPKE